MAAPQSSTVERTIKRLSREIAEIDEFFYLTNEVSDRSQYRGMLERKRDDIVRSSILQLHTAIEDILTSWIICRTLGVTPQIRAHKMKSVPGKALRRMLFGSGSIGFDMKLNMATALGLLSESTRKTLAELNVLRNKCSHNWLLKVPVRQGKRPAQKKAPLLLFRGRDVHNVAALKDLAGEYGALYATLFVKYLDEGR